MQQHLSLVTLGVADLSVSRDFYSTGLGWTPVLDLPDVVFYQVGHGLLLALFGNDDLAADAKSQGRKRGFLPGRESVGPERADSEATAGAAEPVAPQLSLACNVASPAAVDAAVSTARSAGAVVLKAPTTAAWGGYHGYVADPDGHWWEIAYNPGLQVDDDGRVRITTGG